MFFRRQPLRDGSLWVRNSVELLFSDLYDKGARSNKSLDVMTHAQVKQCVAEL